MREWTEEQFDHLLWYLTAEERPVGGLEQEHGEAYAPAELLRRHTAQASASAFAPPGRAAGAAVEASATGLAAGAAGAAGDAEATATSGGEASARTPHQQEPAAPSDRAAAGGGLAEAVEAPPPSVKLELLITFLEGEVEDKELRQRATACTGTGDAEVLFGHNMSGQDALDAYISEIVTMIRDFPFDRLEGGREAGAWVRDEVVAPHFRGRWNFYSNKKHGAGFDLPAWEHLLNGENMLLDSLRYARLKVGL